MRRRGMMDARSQNVRNVDKNRGIRARATTARGTDGPRKAETVKGNGCGEEKSNTALPQKPKDEKRGGEDLKSACEGREEV